ncbi:zinc finger B-box domain-containing protein 1 isoform X2 [Synchiropus splendidus]|uniref:zinc finger B-box domain-containing protein 1 isoform X2 n=1 Tax=Synchiropus splendidus TaxID=270530 RepID=UPI00237DB04F|nr:zinc finger B-box domain-containing protein 1 isoform X2 [Synchiropus splendidus]
MLLLLMVMATLFVLLSNAILMRRSQSGGPVVLQEVGQPPLVRAPLPRHAGMFGWTSGQSRVPKPAALMKDTNKENQLQKLSAGKVKIRVLKEGKPADPAPAQPPPSNRPAEKDRTVVKTAQKVWALNGTEKHRREVTEGRKKQDEMTVPPAPLLRGAYSEEESARSFQEALREWRGAQDDGGEADPTASVSVMATQADLPWDQLSGGRGKWKTAFRVEFTPNNLSYMDRLCLKKHRRTPIQLPRNLLRAEPNTGPDSEEEEAATLGVSRAQEDDAPQPFRASVCDVSAGSSAVASPECNMAMKALKEDWHA